MRTGLAPTRAVHTASPTPPILSLCVVTYSSKHPYYEGREEIVKMCLDSLLTGIPRCIDYELIVWDNGNIPKLKDLLRSYKSFAYVESQNVGGYNGRRGALGIARGKYACICDDDILFSPDWWQRQYEIVRAFPGSLANGVPRDYNGLLDAVKKLDCQIWSGKVQPDQWRKDIAASGVKTAPSRQDEYLVVSRRGIRGWANITDMQLFGETAILQKAHSYYSEWVGTSGFLCERLQKMGVAQLATLKRTIAHIGNVIDPSILATKEAMKTETFEPNMKRMTRIYGPVF